MRGSFASLERVPFISGRAALALISALAAAACGGVDGVGTPVPTGDWRGDIDYPGPPDVAWGATWHIAWSDSSSGLELAMIAPSAGRIGPVSLGAGDDSLRFPLPFNRSAECEVTRREDGSWRGRCPVPGGSGAAEVVLVPPDRELPVGAARTALETIDGDWRTKTSGRAVVYTRLGTEAHRNLDRVAGEARAAVRNAVGRLEVKGRTGPVRLVYLESRREMKRVVGRAVRGWADAGGNAVLLVTDDRGGSPVYHEVVHVVSMREWGTAARPGMWLQEGLAEWVQGGRCGEVPHGRIDRYLHRRGDGLSVSALTGAFRKHSDRITMPQATTLVGYLMDVHGLEAVRELWERGMGEAKAVLGYGTGQLHRRWRDWVRDRYTPASKAEWNASMGREQGCPWPVRADG